MARAMTVNVLAVVNNGNNDDDDYHDMILDLMLMVIAWVRWLPESIASWELSGRMRCLRKNYIDFYGNIYLNSYIMEWFKLLSCLF